MSGKTLIIGGSSSIGKYIKNCLPNTDFTYYKSYIDGGIHFDLSERNLNRIINLNKFFPIL